jgi:hypothetical protein
MVRRFGGPALKKRTRVFRNIEDLSVPRPSDWLALPNLAMSCAWHSSDDVAEAGECNLGGCWRHEIGESLAARCDRQSANYRLVFSRPRCIDNAYANTSAGVHTRFQDLVQFAYLSPPPVRNPSATMFAQFLLKVPQGSKGP